MIDNNYYKTRGDEYSFKHSLQEIERLTKLDNHSEKDIKYHKSIVSKYSKIDENGKYE